MAADHGKGSGVIGYSFLILSAGCSRPGVFVISKIVGVAFTTPQLERVFGPNTIFAINPYHPRHITSIAAIALGNSHLIYQGLRGLRGTTSAVWLTDTKVFFMVLFNSVTSRVTLHIGNQLASKFK